MKATKYVKPYKKIKKKFFVSIPGLNYKLKQKGVYIIKKTSTNKIYYVGKSNSSLYKTILRHFQTWNDKRQERFTYDINTFIVKVIYTKSEKQTNALEQILIKKYKPIDNIDNKYKLFADSEYIKNINEEIKNAEIIEEAPF